MKSRLDPGFSKHALGITIVVMLAACGNKVLDYRNAQITNGKVYAGNADEPFSGKVTNVPFNAVFLNQPGYKKLIGPTNALIMGLYGTSLLCEIEVDDGALNGDVSCKKQQSEVVQVKAHFKGGALVDDFAMYANREKIRRSKPASKKVSQTEKSTRTPRTPASWSVSRLSRTG